METPSAKSAFAVPDMFSKLRGLFGARDEPAPEPLRGRPKVRREKIYSADSGYVYQYFYEGFREAVRGGQSGCEYIFDCTSDRAARISVTVFAADHTFIAWQQETERELNDVEKYALIKMTLFAAFDEREHLTADLDIQLDGERISEHAQTLDL